MRESTGSRFRTAAAAAIVAAAATAPLLGADEIQVRVEQGRVALAATGAPLSDVLAAWSRVGGTRFVGAEAIGGEPITLHLVDATEEQAMRLLLRSAAGYVAAPRRAGAPGSSRYDRVTILAPRSTAAPTPRQPAAAARRVSPPAAAARGAAGPTGLVPMETLQRLLDAAGGNRGSRPPRAAPADAATEIPVVTTPFPGVVVPPDSSQTPGRGRDRR